MANPWLWGANIGGCERISLMFKLGLRRGPPAATSNWLKISSSVPNWPIRWPPMDAPPSSLLIYPIITGGSSVGIIRDIEGEKKFHSSLCRAMEGFDFWESVCEKMVCVCA